MTARKSGTKRPKLEKLELNQESLRELTEGEADTREWGHLQVPYSRLCHR
jgi:hypothetical protein